MQGKNDYLDGLMRADELTPEMMEVDLGRVRSRIRRKSSVGYALKCAPLLLWAGFFTLSYLNQDYTPNAFHMELDQAPGEDAVFRGPYQGKPPLTVRIEPYLFTIAVVGSLGVIGTVLVAKLRKRRLRKRIRILETELKGTDCHT